MRRAECRSLATQQGIADSFQVRQRLLCTARLLQVREVEVARRVVTGGIELGLGRGCSIRHCRGLAWTPRHRLAKFACAVEVDAGVIALGRKRERQFADQNDAAGKQPGEIARAQFLVAVIG